jgi:membrane protease YdiL (CAAX protease family)
VNVPKAVVARKDMQNMNEPIRTYTTIEQHGLGRSILLHLIPGALITTFFAITAQPIIAAGYPAFVALMLGILFVLIPVELGYLLYQGRKRNNRFTLEGIVLYRETVPFWQFVGLAFAILVWAGFLFAIATPVDNFFIEYFFTWMPEWFFFADFTNGLSQYSSSAIIVTVVLALVLNGVAGPVVEELYFRGYLLPRISRYGWWAPVLNAVLFSIYHFFSPWQNLIRILALLPMTFITQWKKNIYIGMWQHVLLNTIGVLLMIVLLLSGG